MTEELQWRIWEDVEVGEALPKLAFPITVKTLALAVGGTRDFAPTTSSWGRTS